MRPRKSDTVRAVQDSFFSRCMNKPNPITSEHILPVPPAHLLAVVPFLFKSPHYSLKFARH